MRRCTVCGARYLHGGGASANVCSVVCRVLSHCSGLDEPDGCWNWGGSVRNHYGVVRVKRADGKWSTRNVHRVVFAETRQPVPHGHSVTHTCGSKLCCNPKHLQLEVQPFYLETSDGVDIGVAA